MKEKEEMTDETYQMYDELITEFAELEKKRNKKPSILERLKDYLPNRINQHKKAREQKTADKIKLIKENVLNGTISTEPWGADCYFLPQIITENPILLDDKEVALTFIKSDCCWIRCFNERLQKDYDCIVEAWEGIRSYSVIDEYCTKEVLSDKDFIWLALTRGKIDIIEHSIFWYPENPLRKDRDFLLELFKYTNTVFRFSRYDDYKAWGFARVLYEFIDNEVKAHSTFLNDLMDIWGRQNPYQDIMTMIYGQHKAGNIAVSDEFIENEFLARLAIIQKSNSDNEYHLFANFSRLAQGIEDLTREEIDAYIEKTLLKKSLENDLNNKEQIVKPKRLKI